MGESLGEGPYTIISIHAPREGCDPPVPGAQVYEGNFNPRTPRGVRLTLPSQLFQLHLISIHAPREGCDGATRPLEAISRLISIHAPREGCDHIHTVTHIIIQISIHAPREGCDGSGKRTSCLCQTFQSTHPARGATVTWLHG